MRDSSRLGRRVRTISARRASTAGRHPQSLGETQLASPQADGQETTLLKSRATGQEPARSAGRARASAGSSLIGPGTYVAALSGLIAFATLSAVSDNRAAVLMISLLIAIAAFVVLPLHRKHKLSGRRQRLERQVPDALDLLVVCTEAGLSLDSAFQRIGRELGMSAPELARELSVTSAELALLPDRRAAIANLAKRTESPSLRVLASSLIQTERYGTPVAQALRVLANEMRDQRMLRAEAKAARLPAIMTIPLIVFILPTLFVVIIGPALLQIYDILSRG